MNIDLLISLFIRLFIVLKWFSDISELRFLNVNGWIGLLFMCLCNVLNR